MKNTNFRIIVYHSDGNTSILEKVPRDRLFDMVSTYLEVYKVDRIEIISLD